MCKVLQYQFYIYTLSNNHQVIAFLSLTYWAIVKVRLWEVIGHCKHTNTAHSASQWNSYSHDSFGYKQVIFVLFYVFLGYILY